MCAIAGKYAGHLLLSDTLKADAVEAIGRLKQLHIDNIQLLSGDKKEIVAIFAKTLGIRHARGGLLPEDKAAYLEKLNAEAGVSAAFVGDGMNDAPVLALSDVGIAMGGLGRMLLLKVPMWLFRPTNLPKWLRRFRSDERPDGL